MAIDPYALCPGGTGKKIKFCCPDQMSQLDELLTMLEGQQHVAALRYLQSLEGQGPPRACLWSIKVRLLRILEREEEVDAAVAAFLGHFPDNPIALAESAIQNALAGEPCRAAPLLQRALAVCDQIEFHFQVYDAVGIVAETLAEHEYFSAARAHWQLQALAADVQKDPTPVRALLAMGRAAHIPLLLKDDPPRAECPEGVPWRDRFEEAMELIGRARWLRGAECLAALARDVPDAPAVWWNLALVRGWLADEAGTVEALRRFAALDVPLEDAVEAEATAILLSEEELGDQGDSLRQTYTLSDAEHVVAVLATSKQAVRLAVDPEQFAGEEIPPKAAFHVTDRPLPETAAELRLETIPRVLGQVFVFGRQTDREARLVVLIRGPADREEMTALLAEWVGGQLVGQPREEKLGRPSASLELLWRQWRLPPDLTRQQLATFAREHIQRALLEEWPQMKLGLLGDRSPEEAAGQPHLRVKLLAAILVLEAWVQQMDERFDFDRLRARLGLPLLAPIDPEGVAVDKLSLIRLHRVMADKLSDEALQAVFRRAFVCWVSEAMGKFAQVLIDRPSIPDKDKLGAYRSLAELEHDSDRALIYLDRGRRAAEADGKSSAPWDLMELDCRTERGEFEEIRRLVEHLQRDHAGEPGVDEALVRFLVRIGVMRPDGSFRADDSDAAPVADDLEPEPVDLWTPESLAPADAPAPGSTADRPKLWTPGMD